jgi:hypothetical protein
MMRPLEHSIIPSFVWTDFEFDVETSGLLNLILLASIRPAERTGWWRNIFDHGSDYVVSIKLVLSSQSRKVFRLFFFQSGDRRRWFV